MLPARSLCIESARDYRRLIADGADEVRADKSDVTRERAATDIVIVSSRTDARRSLSMLPESRVAPRGLLINRRD